MRGRSGGDGWGCAGAVAALRPRGRRAPPTTTSTAARRPGRPKTVTVTIPEGYTAPRPRRWRGKPACADYVKASRGHEGFLFPDTFELGRHAPAADLVQLQLEDFKRRIKGVDMSYARSKNLTTLDVVSIASMIEREAQLEGERKLVAAVIYNRLRDGMALGIDATIRFATGNFDRPLTESRTGEPNPRTTPATQRRPAAGADRQPRPRLDRGRRSPGQGRLPLLRERAWHLRQTRLLHHRRRFQPTLTATTKPVPRPAAIPRHLRRMSGGRQAARSPRPPCRPLALTGDAECGAGGARYGGGVALRGDRGRSGRLRGSGAAMTAEGFAGANVTVPHKAAALALADALSEMVREIGAANTLIFAGGEIHAENTDADGLLTALPASPRVDGAWCSAPAAPPAPRSGLCCGRVPRLGLESHRVAFPAALRRARRRPAPNPARATYELIVNTTAVGLRGEDPFDELPLEDGFAAGQTVVDLVYGEGPSRLLAAAATAGATIVDGIEVLVQQGALSLRIWTGREAPLEVMRAAAR